MIRVVLALVLASLGAAGCGGWMTGDGYLPELTSGDPRPQIIGEASAPAGAPDVLVRRAALYLEHGQVAQAERLNQRALIRLPHHAGALAVDARIAVARNDLDRAWTRFDQAMSQKAGSGIARLLLPELVPVGAALARDLRGQGRLVEALEVMERVGEHASNHPGQVHDALRASIMNEVTQVALLCIRAGIPQRAEQALELTQRLGRGRMTTDAGFARAQLGALNEPTDKVSPALERWALVDPAHRWSRVARWYAGRALNAPALIAYRAAIDADDADLEAWRGLARACMAQREASCAQEAFSRSARLIDEPQRRLEVLLRGARALRERAGGSHSLPLYEASLAVDPGNWDVLMEVLEALKQSRRYETIEAALVAYVRGHSAPDEALARVVRTLRELGLNASAAKVTRRLAELADGPASLPLALAMSLPAGRAHDEERRALLQRHTSQTGDEVAANLESASVWMSVRRFDLVLRHAQRAQALQEGHPGALMLEAQAWEAQGEAQRAEAARRRVRTCADSDLRCAVVASEDELLSVGPGRALNRLEPWLQRDGVELSPDFHRVRYLAARSLSRERPRVLEAALRSWLAVCPAHRRRGTLEDALVRIAGEPSLRGLRVELLRELESWSYLEDNSKRSLIREMHAAGHLEGALEVWERVVAEADDPDEANLEAGSSLQDLGFDEEAVRFFARVDVLRVRKDVMHEKLAKMFVRRGQLDRAIAHYELMMTSDATRRNSMRLKSYLRVLIAHRKSERADEVSRLLLDVAPGNSDSLSYRLQVALLLGDEDARARAVAALVKQASGRRMKIRAWRQVGEAYQAEGRLELAVEAFHNGLVGVRHKNEIGRALQSIARICAVLDTAECWGDLERVPEAVDRQKWADAMWLVVHELEEHGRYDQAGELQEKRLGDGQGKPPKLLSQAFRSAAWRGELVQASQWLKTHLQGARKGSVWAEAAKTWWSVGQQGRALALLEEAVKRFPTDQAVRQARAELLFKHGDRGGAELAYARALTSASEDKGLWIKVTSGLRAGYLLEWWQSVQKRSAASVEARHKGGLARARAALALGQIDRFQALQPKLTSADRRGRVEVAELAREVGYPGLALTLFDGALMDTAHKDEEFPVAAYADLLVAQGRDEERGRRFAEIVRRSKEPGQRMIDVARMFLERGAREEALEWLQLADDRQQRPEIKLLRGHAYLELGDLNRAADLFEDVIRERSIGRAGRHRTRFQRRAVQLANDLNQIVQAFVGRGEFAAGADLVARLRSLNRSHRDHAPFMAGHQAILHLRAGAIQPALAIIEELAFPPDAYHGKPRLWLRLAAALVDRGLRGEAIELLDRVMYQVKSSDLFDEHLRQLVWAGRGRAAWRAARVIMGRFKGDSARRIVQTALEGGMPSLALRVADHARSIQSAGEREALSELLTIRGVGRRAEWLGVAASGPRGELAAADRAVLQGDLREGAARSLAALRMRPGHAASQRRALRLTSVVNDEEGFGEALTLVQRGSGSVPKGLKLAIEALRTSGQNRRALQLQLRLIAHEPGPPEPHLDALDLTLELGDTETADELTEKLLGRWGDQDGVRLAVAEAWQRYGASERASEVADFERDRAGKRAWRASCLRSDVLYSQGRSREAIAALSSAVDHAPDPVSAFVEAFERIQRWGGSREDLAGLMGRIVEPLSRAPEVRLLEIRLAWLSKKGGVATEGLRALLEDKVLPPASVAGAILHATGAGDQPALEMLFSELTAHIGAPEARRIAGLRMLQALDLESVGLGPQLTQEQRRSLALKATELLDRGLGHAFLPSGGHVSALGQAHEIVGRREASLWLYESHALQAPWDSTSRNNWAYALAEAERELPLALTLVRQAIRERGEPLASFLDTEAWILHKLRRHAEALQVMERAILHATDARYQSAEGRVEMLYHYGVILAATGASDRASQVLRTCAARGPKLPYGARCQGALTRL